MSPQEFWLIAEARQPPEMVGSMRKDTFDHLVGLLNDAKPR